MQILPVALAATGASAIVNIWLASRVGRMRIAAGIALGDGGDPRLTARMRAHANFAEYAPLVLILIALIELAHGTRPWLWIVAALFVAARILHGFGMDGWRFGRMAGMMTTALITVGLALYAAALPFLLGRAPF